MKSLLLACTLLAPLAARAEDTNQYYTAFKIDKIEAHNYEMPLEEGWPYESAMIDGMVGKPPKSGSFVETLKIDDKPVCTVTVTPKTPRNKAIMCEHPVRVMCHQVVEIEISSVKGKPKDSGVGFTYITERKPCAEREGA